MDYYLFNTVEALLWFSIASFLAFVAIRRRPESAHLFYSGSVAFFGFGFSDILELFVGSFFEPQNLWLFIWKILNILLIVIVLVWYVIIRLFGEKHGQYKDIKKSA